MNGVKIRTATESDAERLLEIYAPYVTDTAITFEYEVPTVSEFRTRIQNTLRGYPYLVAVENSCEDSRAPGKESGVSRGDSGLFDEDSEVSYEDSRISCETTREGRIIGYAYAGAFHERAAYDRCVEVSIYVDRDARHSGVGRILYEAIEDILKRMHILNVNACIAVPRSSKEQQVAEEERLVKEQNGTRLSSKEALREKGLSDGCGEKLSDEGADPHLSRNSVEFHAHMGYKMVGIFHDCGYKFGQWYDMAWMEKMLGEHSDNPEPVILFPMLSGNLNTPDV